MRRYLFEQLRSDLGEKMVFLAGPRQVGKTTLAQALPGARAGYLSWDIPTDRARILQGRLPRGSIWVFDEIHKYKGWRNFLKGLYDQNKGDKRILVTGSARLDLYRRGGDSLQGRYHFLRMHPLSFREIGGRGQADLHALLQLGGFPEPFFSRSKAKADRWSNEYRSRVVRDELEGLESVTDTAKLELLSYRLPECVGSPLSINSLREDLEIAHKTAARWVQLLERIYVGFRVLPFGSARVKAVKKESKFYLFDWNLIEEPGPRFENLVACHLLKWCHHQEDIFGKPYDLRFFRDIEGREVDFVLLLRGKPISAIECKWADSTPAPSLRRLRSKFPEVRCIQLLGDSSKNFVTPDGIEVFPAAEFLAGLV